MTFPLASQALLTLLAAATAHAVEPGGGVSVREDLLGVLTLREKPCGKIVSHTRTGEGDYEVTCSNGARYRIRSDAERIIVEERDPAR